MLRAVLRHHRPTALAGLALLIVAAWAWLWLGAGIPTNDMGMGSGQIMLVPAEWTAGYAGMIVLMWAVMMAAMMLPSAAPTILLVDSLARRSAPIAAATARFILGYLIVWTGFSLGATLIQWALDRAGLLREDMVSASHVLAGMLLLAAGLYQFSPLKRTCLDHCRAPFDFLARHWKLGPLRAGLRHGLFCLGCCWVMMGLLFVGGLMNLAWIAMLAVLVLIEKLAPLGGRTPRLTGAVMAAGGLWVLTIAL